MVSSHIQVHEKLHEVNDFIQEMALVENLFMEGPLMVDSLCMCNILGFKLPR